MIGFQRQVLFRQLFAFLFRRMHPQSLFGDGFAGRLLIAGGVGDGSLLQRHFLL